MIVSIQTFNDYTGNYEDSANVVAIKNTCLGSAEQLVKDYLRYDPVSKSYTDVLIDGNGQRKLPLPAVNITLLSALSIGGEVQDITKFVIKNDYLRFADLQTCFPVGIENIEVSFTAGFTPETMPEVIALTILRIATLMLMESGENIGVSGKSMPDNSRTFINYTNYYKYLAPLQNLRLAVF